MKNMRKETMLYYEIYKQAYKLEEAYGYGKAKMRARATARGRETGSRRSGELLSISFAPADVDDVVIVVEDTDMRPFIHFIPFSRSQ